MHAHTHAHTHSRIGLCTGSELVGVVVGWPACSMFNFWFALFVFVALFVDDGSDGVHRCVAGH